ncbi:MAG: PfkB family carbohydrate kinase [Acetobacteraceae bacterium]
MMLDFAAAEDSVREIRALSGTTKRITFVSGIFNIVHPGHLRLLKFAAELGDLLVVGVIPDGSRGVTLPAEMRMEAIRAISLVDYAVLLPESPEAFIRRLQPDFVVKGKEYESRDNPERDVVASYGGALLFTSGEVTFSSLDLLHREYLATNYTPIDKPLDYPARHGFRVGDLTSVLERFDGLRVLVIGDVILDEYVSCDPLGMSQEDPTIVVTPIESKMFMGGAGIVAAHASGIGADVSFVTILGDDERAGLARDMLTKLGIETHAFADPTRPTSLKQRFRAHGKTLLRVNHLRQHALVAEAASRMVATIDDLLDGTDLLLFADFNYGCLPQSVVDAVVAAAGRRGVMMAADSQASSQISDISRYRGMKLITPTEREARLAMRDSDSGLVVLAEALQKKADAENVVVTLGSEGLLLHALEEGGYRTDRLPAFNTAPKDVVGAGDSFFTCASMALCTGVDIWRSAYLGSLAAACQVGRLGNVPLSVGDLVAEIEAPALGQIG